MFFLYFINAFIRALPLDCLHDSIFDVCKYDLNLVDVLLWPDGWAAHTIKIDKINNAFKKKMFINKNNILLNKVNKTLYAFHFSIMVGAPRAQSSLASQRTVNETGAIYRCSLATEKCAPYNFDTLGNTIYEKSDYTINDELKEYQWLGATCDGNGRESDRFVVSRNCFALFISI